MGKNRKIIGDEEFLVVRPSDLRKVAFCPTLFFFDIYLKKKPPVYLRLKALWGRMLHVLHHALRVGWTKEELLYAPIETYKVVLVGRPDTYREEADGGIVIEEFKSRKAPRHSSNIVYHGVWISDALQLIAYGYILKSIKGVEPKLVLRYINRSVSIPYDEDMLIQYVELLKDIVEGVFPEPQWVSSRKCRRCPYRDICPYSPYSTISFT